MLFIEAISRHDSRVWLYHIAFSFYGLMKRIIMVFSLIRRSTFYIIFLVKLVPSLWKLSNGFHLCYFNPLISMECNYCFSVFMRVVVQLLWLPSAVLYLVLYYTGIQWPCVKLLFVRNFVRYCFKLMSLSKFFCNPDLLYFLLLLAGQNPAFLFVCDTSKFWHKENMTRDEGTFANLNSHLQECFNIIFTMIFYMFSYLKYVR